MEDPDEAIDCKVVNQLIYDKDGIFLNLNLIIKQSNLLNVYKLKILEYKLKLL